MYGCVSKVDQVRPRSKVLADQLLSAVKPLIGEASQKSGACGKKRISFVLPVIDAEKDDVCIII